MVVLVRKEVPAHPTPEKRCLGRQRLDQVVSYGTSRLKQERKRLEKVFRLDILQQTPRA